ncbi:MAG: hypothetical protein IJ935_07405 [Afipia sp.]|nr:hypothetical protein [Afipia sp.]
MELAMSTWAQWREAAKTPFTDGERVQMEDGESKKARVPKAIARRAANKCYGNDVGRRRLSLE